MAEYIQLSYAQLLKDRLEFMKSGTNSGSEFNIYDTAGHKYFKILFYFGDSAVTSNKEGLSNGLLHPTWKIFNEESNFGLKEYDYNSAWSFLVRNDELERAEKLEKFITLLSNINSHSPWYFTSISGIDSALERSGPDSEKLEIGEPKKLTITCLPDSFDNRIGTLLELYRDITWSWIQKKQILPVNLRKFDMAIYIFESPIKFWHDKEDTIIDGKDKTKYQPSYKMLEFHDCEFSYNSIKSGWSELNNQTGVSPTYSIEISYNDCYEISYNEHLMRTIGDVISTDTYNAIIKDNTNVSNNSFKSESQKDSNTQITAVQNRLNAPSSTNFAFGDKFDGGNTLYSFGNLENDKSDRKNIIENSDGYTTGFLENASGQLVNLATSYAERKLTRAVLGNLYTYSLTKIGTQLSELEKGNLIKTGQSVKQYIENAQKRKNDGINIPPNSNLGTGYGNYNEQQPSGNLGTGYGNYDPENPNGNLGTGYGNYENKPVEGEIFDSTPVSYKGYGVSLGNLSNRGKLHPSSIANN